MYQKRLPLWSQQAIKPHIWEPIMMHLTWWMGTGVADIAGLRRRHWPPAVSTDHC